MQSWIYLGSSVYVANRADHGFLRIEGYTFSGPEIELSGEIFGGAALQFIGSEGMHTTLNNMIEGWLSFKDPKFPELTLTVVLQIGKKQSALRYVLTTETSEEFIMGSMIYLMRMNLPASSRFSYIQDGKLTALTEEQTLIGTVLAETDCGSILFQKMHGSLSQRPGGDFEIVQVLDLKKETLIENGQFSTDWLRYAYADKPEELMEKESQKN